MKIISSVLLLFFLVLVIGKCVDEFKDENVEPKSYETVNALMEYIGARKILEKELLLNAKFKVFEDTIVGLSYEKNRFFLHGLNDTNFFKIIAPGKDVPDHLKVDKYGGKSFSMYFFEYYKNGCIYFANMRNQIELLCKDGSYKKLLTEKAINKRKGFLKPGPLIYNKGYLIQETSYGIYIFKEKTGEFVWEYAFNDFGNWGGMLTINDKLFFTDVNEFEKTTAIYAINLANQKRLWSKKIQDYQTGGLKTNGSDVFTVTVSSGNDTFCSYFIKSGSGELLSKTPYYIGYLSGERSNSKLLSGVKENFAYVLTEKGTAKFNFRKNELVWKAPGSFSFSYGKCVVTRDHDARKYYVIDSKSGKVLKDFYYRERQPDFSFYEKYIFVGKKVYK